MTEQTWKQKLMSFDNKMTFIIGYRNLYNFVVLMIASMSLYYGDVLGTPYFYMLSLLLYIMGGKWFLDQARENIDALDVKDALSSTV